jgi:hypothetical protein
MESFKTNLLHYFVNRPVRKELQNKQLFDDKLIATFKNDFKIFIKQYVLSIKGYDMKLYGPTQELQ